MPDLLTIAGILITVVLGVCGIFFAKKVSNKRQSQNVKGGTAIQAGRDVKICDKIE